MLLSVPFLATISRGPWSSLLGLTRLLCQQDFQCEFSTARLILHSGLFPLPEFLDLAFGEARERDLWDTRPPWTTAWRLTQGEALQQSEARHTTYSSVLQRGQMTSQDTAA